MHPSRYLTALLLFPTKATSLGSALTQKTDLELLAQADADARRL
jgi:hypothetical protein